MDIRMKTADFDLGYSNPIGPLAWFPHTPTRVHINVSDKASVEPPQKSEEVEESFTKEFPTSDSRRIVEAAVQNLDLSQLTWDPQQTRSEVISILLENCLPQPSDLEV
ncbi:hypothetical protein Clacol_005859 [Clathrus columnatus]|uniref:Uncharacterized protein n=1 Tax=Clathrus columnatus TaxID=1419009 RepID=A0AAV5AG30_9AGAM|nr:hypothetical protein Clacol_005859 [Clathrus columnatus]